MFECHYEEGYNIYIDQDYVQWLELYHPDSLPADRYSLTPFTEPSVSASPTDQFISIVPEVPITNVDPDTSGGDVLQSKGTESVATVSPDAASVVVTSHLK